MFYTAKMRLKFQGIKGLFEGNLTRQGRHIPEFALTFGLFESIRTTLFDEEHQRSNSFLSGMLSGFFSGVAIGALNNPFEVAQMELVRSKMYP